MAARHAATGPRRRLRASAGLVTIVALLAMAGVSAGPGRAATSTWTITLTPSTVEALQATTIKATFWNLGGPDGQQDLGCVRIAIPATFTVGATQVTDSPPGTTWKASKAGLTTVTIKTPSGGDRLPPGNPGASVTAAITVSAVLPGTYTWTANAFRAQDCKGSFNDPAQLSVVVTLTLLPTPTPTPTPTQTRSRPRSRRSRRCRPSHHCRPRRRDRRRPRSSRPRRRQARPRLRRRPGRPGRRRRRSRPERRARRAPVRQLALEAARTPIRRPEPRPPWGPPS